LAKNWLQLYLAKQEREVFVVIYLDNQHRLLEHETLFLGTINHTEIHPREIVKSALRHNAAAVIISHNHPSGITDASKADRAITFQDYRGTGAGRCPATGSFHHW
jgi:DNA repair protein RadC